MDYITGDEVPFNYTLQSVLYWLQLLHSFMSRGWLSVKIEEKDQSDKRNAYFYYFGHFVYFSCISDRNLLIL